MATQVSVKVNAQGKPSCTPDELSVGKSNGTVVIKWSMDTAGYKITGITKNNGDPLKASVFSSSKANGNTGWKITDKNDDTKSYKYKLVVESTSTGEEVAHDPVIKNGGRN